MKYLIKNNDGTVCVMTTVSDDIDPALEIEKWGDDIRGKVESFRPMEESEIPEDRYFREAWEHKEDSLTVNLDKCKSIHKDTLRELRSPKLQALDVDYMRAVESGDAEKQKEISEKKQVLRDIPQAPEIENATTPEEIKTFMPDILL